MMRQVQNILSILSFIMVVDVAWLHAAARLGVQETAPGWMTAVWGLSVPYFFAVSVFWQIVRKRGFREEVVGRIKRLLVPYFIWCWLGALWSIALHGVQLHGWDLLRYVGLQPGWDPAYQPMWFLRALFLVTVGVACVQLVWTRYQGSRRSRVVQGSKVKAQCDGFSKDWCREIRGYVFPVYVLHSMFQSLMSVMGVKIGPFGMALVSVAASVVTACGMRCVIPKYAIIFFGK